jgi:hypothetical protein
VCDVSLFEGAPVRVICGRWIGQEAHLHRHCGLEFAHASACPLHVML